MKQRIERAKELVQTVRHAAIATVNEDGSPHNSPVFAAFDEQLNVYWASTPDTQHSRNIARSGQAFIVAYDATDKGGGLYIQASARVLSDSELDTGLAVFNTARKHFLREEVPREFFVGSANQRLYRAEPVKVWVNISKKDEAGRYLYDKRVEITPGQIKGEA